MKRMTKKWDSMGVRMSKDNIYKCLVIGITFECIGIIVFLLSNLIK